MMDERPRGESIVVISSLSKGERQFLALAIQGLCMRQGPDAFALAARVSQSLGLTAELGALLQSWIDYAKKGEQ